MEREAWIISSDELLEERGSVLTKNTQQVIIYTKLLEYFQDFYLMKALLQLSIGFNSSKEHGGIKIKYVLFLEWLFFIYPILPAPLRNENEFYTIIICMKKSKGQTPFSFLIVPQFHQHSRYSTTPCLLNKEIRISWKGSV